MQVLSIGLVEPNISDIINNTEIACIIRIDGNCKSKTVINYLQKALGNLHQTYR